MEFIILKNTEIEFPRCSASEETLITRLSTSVKAQVGATEQEDGTTNAMYSQNLITAIIEDPWTHKSDDHLVDWNFTVGISLPNPSWKSSIGDDGYGSSTASLINGSFCSIKIVPTAEKSNSFLGYLQNFNLNSEDASFEENVTLKVVVKKFGEKDKSAFNWPSVSLKAKEFGKFELDEGNWQPLALVSNAGSTFSAWKSGQEFRGICTIYVVLSNSALSYLHSMNLTPIRRFKHLKSMLKNEIGTDIEILVGVSPNQKVVKCHRAFLMAGSEVFQRMFESGLREARENKIEIEGISENGLRAFLAFLYYYETKAAFESSRIALELLEASEKYDVEDLKETVLNIMLARESSWFDVDTALSLYIFVKKLCPDEEEIQNEEPTDEDDEVESEENISDEDGVEDDMKKQNPWEPVKVKSLKVLKWYTQKMPKALLESTKYQEIFSGDPKLGLEIYSAILRLK